MVAFFQILLFAFMVILMLFMLLIILLQRGKGGGLVGAFGGMGGNSAFGAKSTDVFMKITIWTAVIWFVACVAGGYLFKAKSGSRSLVADASAVQQSADVVTDQPAENAVPVESATENATPAENATPVENATPAESAPVENAAPVTEGSGDAAQ